MQLHKYTLDQLKQAIDKSTSLRQVLIKLNVAAYGGNYQILKKAIQHFKLSTSHFTGQAWNKGKIMPEKYSLNDYLENKSAIQSFKLKNRLIKHNLLKPVCSNCKSKHWSGKSIP